MTVIPPADMQRRARKIAMEATKLANQAGPMTKNAAITARQRADTAAIWARPRVSQARAWMAVRAARGSVAVQETVAPRVAAMLAATAKRLDPPKPKARRIPKVLAGMALLAAGGAAAAAMAMRARAGSMPPPLPPGGPRPTSEQPPTVLNPSAEGERMPKESDVNGLSRTNR